MKSRMAMHKSHKILISGAQITSDLTATILDLVIFLVIANLEAPGRAGGKDDHE